MSAKQVLENKLEWEGFIEKMKLVSIKLKLVVMGKNLEHVSEASITDNEIRFFAAMFALGYIMRSLTIRYNTLSKEEKSAFIKNLNISREELSRYLHCTHPDAKKETVVKMIQYWFTSRKEIHSAISRYNKDQKKSKQQSNLTFASGFQKDFLNTKYWFQHYDYAASSIKVSPLALSISEEYFQSFFDSIGEVSGADFLVLISLQLFSDRSIFKLDAPTAGVTEISIDYSAPPHIPAPQSYIDLLESEETPLVAVTAGHISTHTPHYDEVMELMNSINESSLTTVQSLIDSGLALSRIQRVVASV